MKKLMSTVILAAITSVILAAQQTAAPPLPPETRAENTVNRQMAARKIPGLALGVVRDGELVLAKGFGEATLEWKAPATPDTVFLVASMTKQFTATAIMLLVRDGKVALDDQLSKFVPDVPAMWNGITVRHLLTHTAGLKDPFELDEKGRMLLDYSTAQMLEAAKRMTTVSAPGKAWQYSDEGYFLLGMVIERASGQTYGQFLKQRIFDPAGMTNTTLHDWKAIVPNRADGYALDGEKLVASRRRYQFELVPHYGVQSTVRDLAKYDAALSAGTLLPAAMLDEMWKPARLSDGQPVDVAGIGYGFGWFLERFRGHREVYHGGSTGTCLYRLPDDRVSVIVLTNLEQVSGSDPCGIARMVAAQYVLDIAIVRVPPTTDPDAARTNRLKAALDAFVQGKPDPADYTPAAFAVLAPMAKAQGPQIASLGPPTSFELIADDALVTPVLWYRATYRTATLQWRFVLDRAGKIASLQAR
jgi:D-alanyl-D-alanine carboxypeptidase